MSCRTTASRGLHALSRSGLQCERSPHLRLPVFQSRSISAIARRISKPCSSVIIRACSPDKRHGLARLPLTISMQRSFSATPVAIHGDWSPPKPGQELYVTFIDKDGDEIKLAVNKGDNLLVVAQANDIEMEGACEGSCSCSTCHVIVENEEIFDKMEEASDDENDMLDLAFGLTETSRLGCQIEMTEELDGLRVRLPSMTRNMQASDFEKKK